MHKGKPLTEQQIDMRKQKAVKRRQIALEKSEKAKVRSVVAKDDVRDSWSCLTVFGYVRQRNRRKV